MTVLRVAVVLLLVVIGCGRVPSPPAEAPPDVAAPSGRREMQTFSATAYSIEGRTKSGVQTRRGIVAADPRVLPLGSRIRVHDAGEYNGEYVVHDTGPAIKGREIDIYMPSDAAAKRFGRRTVKVEVLSRGEGR
jgi:3D (Asp-Asp-Asp) domain-containing protein